MAAHWSLSWATQDQGTVSPKLVSKRCCNGSSHRRARLGWTVRGPGKVPDMCSPNCPPAFSWSPGLETRPRKEDQASESPTKVAGTHGALNGPCWRLVAPFWALCRGCSRTPHFSGSERLKLWGACGGKSDPPPGSSVTPTRNCPSVAASFRQSGRGRAGELMPEPRARSNGADPASTPRTYRRRL